MNRIPSVSQPVLSHLHLLYSAPELPSHSEKSDIVIIFLKRKRVSDIEKREWNIQFAMSEQEKTGDKTVSAKSMRKLA